MPPKGTKLLQDVVQEVGVYPAEAYLFVQQGLSYTVQKVHAKPDRSQCQPACGRQASLRWARDLCLSNGGSWPGWFSRWNVTSTMDFGRIVFAMVEHDLLQKTDQDSDGGFPERVRFQDAGDRIQD